MIFQKRPDIVEAERYAGFDGLHRMTEFLNRHGFSSSWLPPRAEGENNLPARTDRLQVRNRHDDLILEVEPERWVVIDPNAKNIMKLDDETFHLMYAQLLDDPRAALRDL